MDDSLFISSKVYERTITTPKGEITIWLKELPNTSYMRFQAAMTSRDDDVRSQAIQRLVAEALCEPDGKPALTFEKACALKVTVLDQIYKHATTLDKADDLGKDSPSAEKSGSGTPSPSPSADDQ